MKGFDPKAFELLSGFSEADVEALVEQLEPQKLSKGRKLFREGSESEGLVFVAGGEIELSSKRTGETARFGAGTVLGGLALANVGLREMTVATIEPCEIWRLPPEQWRRLVDDAPRSACRLLEAILAETGALVRAALDPLSEGL